MSATAVRARPTMPIDPRIRQRRVAVIRSQGRRRLRILLALAGIAGLTALGVYVTHSPLLDVHHLRVSGNVNEPVSAIEAAAGIVPGQTAMISVDPSTASRAVAALPWIDSARVTRHWPWSVDIAVTERSAVAVALDRHGGGVLVDPRGRVLGPVGEFRPSPAVPAVPLLVGIAPAPKAGRSLGPGAAPLLGVAAALPADLRAGTHQLVAEPDAAVDLVWGDSLVVLLGPPRDLGAKVEALVTMLAKADLTGARSIDLQDPAIPTVSR